MKILFSVNCYDKDGDIIDKCVQLHIPVARGDWGAPIGPQTILRFCDSNEVEEFANSILNSLKEIRENENNN